MRFALTPAVVLAVAVLTLGACGGSSASESGGDRTTAPGSGRSSSTASTDPDVGAIDVRVVADSEVSDGVSELLDQRPGIRVASMMSIQGATMAELDPSVDAALAEHPDVLVYAGGTNDLASGPQAVLDGIGERLGRYTAATCVVMAVPIFRYERGTEAEVQARTAGTRLLESAVADAGARVVSYLDISLAMDARGEDFFAEGELGDLHPAPSSYPAIADAIAEQVRACA
jgi:hypothetical protein